MQIYCTASVQLNMVKKRIILHMGTEEHRDPGTSSPQGEPETPPSVLTPQSPCTATRAVGVGTLYRDTIYAATAKTKLTQQFVSPGDTTLKERPSAWAKGGSSLPSGQGRVLGQGHPHPPSARARAATEE